MAEGNTHASMATLMREVGTKACGMGKDLPHLREGSSMRETFSMIMPAGKSLELGKVTSL